MGLSPAFLEVLRFSSMNPDSFFGSGVQSLVFGLRWVLFSWKFQLNI